MSVSSQPATGPTVNYVEPRASTKKWLKDNVVPSKQSSVDYAKSLFPIMTWIYRYNWTWFLGDAVAGLTVGVVVIPQGMAYAKLAQLPPEFGLYSSFVGCALYFMFATSKDITIGPVAVMSTLLGNILTDVLPQLPQYKDTPWIIAGCMSVVLGCIVTALGLLRLGFIVDFIPLPAIAAFMTGSALNIAMGQVPALLGNNSVKSYNTRAPTYLVFGNFFKHIKSCDINSAVGLTALAAGKRWPQRERLFFFLSTLRTAFVILLYTLISYLVNRHSRTKPRFSILGTIPKGFRHMNVPHISSDILSAVSGHIPAAIIVLIIEHISISKSFGRINNYTINPNQELIAIGITNICGPFFGAYPATGSFSRTAIKAKAGVRTPLAGVITAVMVVFAIYILPPVFFYIPNALLAAVIIHAVGDLISGPKALRQFWKISPIEFFIFWIGVIVSVFSGIDNGIYASVAASAALLLFRIRQGPGQSRNAFVSLDHSDGTNPSVKPTPPPSGIFIYRLNESYLYPNAVHFTDHMVEQILLETRPGVVNPYGSLGNRPWNDPGPRHKTESDIDMSKPELRAVILDFSGVSNVDITSVQNLTDVRQQLDRHADCSVSWHFAGIKSQWIRRSLIAAGFGSSKIATRTIFSVANSGSAQDADTSFRSIYDEERGPGSEKKGITESVDGLHLPVLSTEYPNFHIDLDEALKAAEAELWRCPQEMC
ncbi:sulfate permease [Linderina pennispora]|uniref:Sulfate permease n=1 Tax=Linderina pennispora TaxID=61395 RepID=A0A1Y1VS72_9FUNG|nr:sulfate permease [Linderina pennispora]ORX64129.1 sulfate permease [Linderina pennispora]